jgi:hypothetical protein
MPKIEKESTSPLMRVASVSWEVRRPNTRSRANGRQKNGIGEGSQESVLVLGQNGQKKEEATTAKKEK